MEYSKKQLLPSILGMIFKLLLIIIFIFPFFWMFSTSLQTTWETLQFPPTLIPSIPQWQNYKTAWTSGPFDMYTKNSIIIIISITILQMLIIIPAAYAFAKRDFPCKSLLFAIIMVGFMMPSQVTFLPTYLMMAKWGVLKTLLPQILPHIASAFGIFLLRQYFMQVPEELIESARLDNAGELQIITRILVPMAKPGIATILLFEIVGKWNDYFWPLVMTDAAEVRPLTIGIALLKETEGLTNWNVVMAGNVILVIPVLIAYCFASKYIIKAFAYSGIK